MSIKKKVVGRAVVKPANEAAEIAQENFVDATKEVAVGAQEETSLTRKNLHI